MKKTIHLFMLFTMCLFIASNLMASDFRISTQVFIGCNDVADERSSSSIEKNLESQINRNLRMFGDVIITDKKPDFTIHIIGLYNSNFDAIFISSTVIRHFDYSYFLIENFKRKVSNIYVDTVMINLLKKYESYGNSTLYLWGRDSLNEGCVILISEFDLDYLEPKRKLDQSMRDHNLE